MWHLWQLLACCCCCCFPCCLGIAYPELELPLPDNVGFGTKVGSLAKLDNSLPAPPFTSTSLTSMEPALDGFFGIDEQSTVEAQREIDRDDLCQRLRCCQLDDCRASFEASLTSKDGRRHLRRVVVRIADENDQSPTFSSPAPVVIGEDAAVGNSDTRLPQAVDRDSPKHGVAGRYKLDDNSGTFGLFVGQDGQPRLRLLKPLDREKAPQYQVTLTASDGLHAGSAVVTVKVGDVNDNPPIFDREIVSETLPESTKVGERVATLLARDADFGENATVVFKMLSVTPEQLQGHFRVARDSDGVWGVFLQEELDFEQESHRSARVVVVASDLGRPPLSATGVVNVALEDVNDNDPVISELVAYRLHENNGSGVLVRTLQVTDADAVSAGRVSCSLESGPTFRLNSTGDSGGVLNVFSATSFDYEVSHEETVVISCTDNARPKRRSSLKLKIPIEGINEFSPQFLRNTYHESVSEDLAVGRTVLRVKAKDNDGGRFGEVAYSLDEAGRRNFTIKRSTGTVEVATRLDREVSETLVFRVVATDAGGRSATAKVTVQLLDVNDCRPRYVGPLRVTVVENSAPGTQVGVVAFKDEDKGENGSVSFRLRPSRHNIGNQYLRLHGNGSLVVAKRIDRESLPSRSAKFFVEVEASDSGRPRSLSSTAIVQVDVLDVNDNRPEVQRPRPGELLGASAAVYTNVPTHSLVLSVEAEDLDQGDNGSLTFSLGRSNSSGLFSVDADRGDVHTAWDPDSARPPAGVYAVVVEVSDRGSPKPQSTSVDFFVKLSAPPRPTLRFGSARVSGLVILVVIIAGTVVVAVGLIVAICLVRARTPGESPDCEPGKQRRHRQQQQQQQQQLLRRQFTDSPVGGFDPVKRGFCPWQPADSPMATLHKDKQVYRPMLGDQPCDCVQMEMMRGGGGGQQIQQQQTLLRQQQQQQHPGQCQPSPRPVPHPDSNHERRHSEDASVDDSGRGGSVEDVKMSNTTGTFTGPLTLPRSYHSNTLLVRPSPSPAGTMI